MKDSEITIVSIKNTKEDAHKEMIDAMLRLINEEEWFDRTNYTLEDLIAKVPYLKNIVIEERSNPLITNTYDKISYIMYYTDDDEDYRSGTGYFEL